MKWKSRCVRCGLAAALLFNVLAAQSQARKIHEYKLHEQEDRGAPFAMTLGPDHTVYTLIPRRDGNWVLSEVQNWWQDKPHEIGILVPGFSQHDAFSDLRQMDLAVTPDNKYLVAITTGGMRVANDDPYPTDMMVEVTRLDSFEMLTADHMRSLGMRGTLRAGMDRSGQLLVRSEMAGSADAGPYVTWFAVSIPDVKGRLLCSYQASSDAKDAQPMEQACAEAARTGGFASAAELNSAIWGTGAPPPAPAAPPGVSIPSKDRFDSRTVTIDGTALTLVVINGVTLQVYAAQ